MTKNKRVIIIIITLIILFLASVITSICLLYNNYEQKLNKDIYIVIEKHEITDGIIINKGNVEIIYKEVFTDELTFNYDFNTSHGYNHINISNGIAKVTASDCPNPFGINGCQSHTISNKGSLFSHSTIICMQHGLVIRLEVGDSEN